MSKSKAKQYYSYRLRQNKYEMILSSSIVSVDIRLCLSLLVLASIYVLLRLHVQNRRKKWNLMLNFRTMRKLSDLYSGIFQTQSSGCVSGLDHIGNFTNLKILNI